MMFGCNPCFVTQWMSFSYVGFGIRDAFLLRNSLAPSLLPRNYVVQGLESGLALAVGYGLGVSRSCGSGCFLNYPAPGAKLEQCMQGSNNGAAWRAL